MAPQTTTTGSEAPAYRRQAGDEPLPGYRLLEPLGKGGFGEVWKCEAPGGMHKAIKFVTNSAGNAANSLEVEYEAFQHIKKIRHPFLLNLERVELINDELIMVMELADEQLQDRFRAFTAQGYPGIPREELLGYLGDAAEMLDFISAKHGLQHLDIKPANLFLVCDRVKVGDFGLVRRHELTPSPDGLDRGLTPRYVAPEILHGRVDARSDQYCLALVYQELLTGVFPYNARSAQQMMLQHVSTPPNLTPLPEADRFAVSKALAKAPTDRFPSCKDFIRALILGNQDSHGPHVDTDTWGGSQAIMRNTTPDPRITRMPRVSQSFELPAAPPGAGVDPAALTGRMTQPPAGRNPSLTTQQRNLPQLNVPRKNVPTLSGGGVGRAGLQPTEETIELVSLSATQPGPAQQQVRLERIWSILPTHRLTNHGSQDFIAPDVNAVIESLVIHATPDGRLPKSLGEPLRRPDGLWSASFPIRPISGVARIKLELLKESWKAEIEQLSQDEFIVRRYHDGGMWQRWSGKKSGLLIHLKLPPPNQVIGDAVLTGQPFGEADPSLLKASEELLPFMLHEVRGILGNAEDRRKSIRVPIRWSVALFPLSSEGVIGQPMPARLRDISTGGICAISQYPLETAYVYLVVKDLEAASPWALLTRMTRATAEPNGYILAGRFRTDL